MVLKNLFTGQQQSPSAVILEPKKIKSLSFHFFPIYTVCCCCCC